MQDASAAKLSSIKTYLLVAFIFEIIALLLFLFYTLVGIFDIIGLLYVIPLILTIVVLMRTRRMRRAAQQGDIAALQRSNSLLWAIIALIFGGIIPGIMLLIALGPIRDLSSSGMGMGGMQSGTFAPAQTQWSSAPPTGDIKFCSNCGAKMAKAATFCPSCGAKQT